MCKITKENRINAISGFHRVRGNFKTSVLKKKKKLQVCEKYII